MTLQFASSPLEFRIRKRMAIATLEEVRDALATDTLEGEDMEELLSPLVSILAGGLDFLDKYWGQVLADLQTTGLPDVTLTQVTEDVRGVLVVEKELLALLQKYLPTQAEQLRQAADILARVGRQVASVEASLSVPMEVDPERQRRGLEEAARGEGIDSGVLLEQYQQTGEL